MRFLIPPQTIAEYKHRKMPVFETLAAIGATTIVGSLTVGGLAAAAGTAAVGAAASYGASKLLSGGGGPPGSSSYTGGQYVPTAASFSAAQQAQEKNLLGSAYDPNSSLGFAQQFANAGTKQNINLQNKVTPGSSAQRELAQQQLNSYIQGQIPQDVQQNINRQVAQNLGGGFNLFSGGGQAPQNFARNIGQTSLGLSQFGLSAAPTWQQLANSMVVSPATGAQVGFMAGQLGNQQVLGASGIGMQNAENQYQAGYNQWAGQNAQNQQAIQSGISGANAATNLLNSGTMANYYKGLGSGSTSGASYNPGQGYMNTMMGTGYLSPAATTGFGQQSSQIPASYYGNQSFASGLNPALNFMQ